MKFIIIFLAGTLAGAVGAYFGLTQQLMVLSSGQQLVQVDRVAGTAKAIFVSTLEANVAIDEEDRKLTAIQEQQSPEPPSAPADKKKTPWPEMTAEEVAKMDFNLRVNSSRLYATWHNPFEKPIHVERVKVVFPAQNGKESKDLVYKVDWIVPALRDGLYNLDINVEGYAEESIQVTPARVLISPE